MTVQQRAEKEIENRVILKRFTFESLQLNVKVNQEELWTSVSVTVC